MMKRAAARDKRESSLLGDTRYSDVLYLDFDSRWLKRVCTIMSDTSETHSFSKLRQVDEKFKLPALPKATIKYPSIKDFIFHRRNGRRTQYYFTSGHQHLGDPIFSKDDQSPFLLPPKSHWLAYSHWWKDRSARKEKKSAIEAEAELLEKSKDVLRRIRVDVELEEEEGAKKHKDLDKATAMTDIDPNYFTDMNGRPIGERFSMQSYIDAARRVLRTRLLIGEERDDCIRIDQQFAEEQRRLDETKENYRICVNGFEEFLSKDHEESMLILKEAEEEVKLTFAATTKRNQLSKDLGQLRLEVYSLEESWRTVKMCQKFLYQISPISWRLEHDWIHRSSSGSSILSAKPDDLLGRYKSPDNAVSLESLIDLFESEVAEAPPPQLYFKDPKELMRVFRSMELQNLNALIHLESLAGPMAEMASSIIETETLIKQELGEIEDGLADLKENIGAAEERATSLEKYASHLLHGVFRNLVCSEAVLYLRVFIEDTYETCVGPNDANLDSYTMMHLVEKTCEQLNMELDNLPHEIVRVCEKEGFRQEMKAMRDAEDAARKFELMHRLLASLERIMEAPKVVKKRRKSRSRAVSIGGSSANKPKDTTAGQVSPALTEQRATFLNFFTDYCKLDNPANFEAQLPDDFDLTFKSKATLAKEAEKLEMARIEKGDKSNRAKFCSDKIEKKDERAGENSKEIDSPTNA